MRLTHENHSYPLTVGTSPSRIAAYGDSSVWESSVPPPAKPFQRVEQSYAEASSDAESPYAASVRGGQVEGRTNERSAFYHSELLEVVQPSRTRARSWDEILPPLT